MPPRDPEAVRKKVLEDPETRRIAETLGLSVDEYVSQVVEFAMNPSSEPEFVYIPDDELKRMGAPPPPSAEEMASFVRDGTRALDARTKSAFEDAPAPPGGGRPKGAV